MKRSCLYSVLIFILGLSHVGLSQDISRIGQGQAFRMNGGLSFNQIAYGAWGMQQSRDPYSYFASGNLNFDIYGFSVPLTFTYSNQDFGFQQPFNQFGISPTYNNLTLHAGFRSMHFSQYTLGGHVFLGVGLEAAATEKIRVSAMYGRLRRAVAYDSTKNVDYGYKRMGYGAKTSYRHKGHSIEFIFFKSADDPSSLTLPPDLTDLTAEENLVFGLNLSTTIWKKIVLSTEMASSSLTRDTRAEGKKHGNYNLFRLTDFWQENRNSTSQFNAIKANVSYVENVYSIGLGYERVDPEYATHGAYFFNNDLENMTINGSLQLLENKISISGNVGSQRNNLHDENFNSMRRLLSSININFMASQQLMLSGAYSNFTTHMHVRDQLIDASQLTPFDVLDTLRFTQIAESANLNVGYSFSAKDKIQQNLMLNLAVQKASDRQGTELQNMGNIFFNVNAGYSFNLTEKKLGGSLSVNANRNQSQEFNSSIIGPNLNVNKGLFNNQLRVTGGLAWNLAYTEKTKNNDIINMRIGGNYVLAEKHNFALSTILLSRENLNQPELGKRILELTANLSYNFNF